MLFLAKVEQVSGRVEGDNGASVFVPNSSMLQVVEFGQRIMNGALSKLDPKFFG